MGTRGMIIVNPGKTRSRKQDRPTIIDPHPIRKNRTAREGGRKAMVIKTPPQITSVVAPELTGTPIKLVTKTRARSPSCSEKRSRSSHRNREEDNEESSGKNLFCYDNEPYLRWKYIQKPLVGRPPQALPGERKGTIIEPIND